MIDSLITRLAVTLDESKLNIPKSSFGEDGQVIQNALQLFFGIAGAVAVLIIAIGAFKYVISRGDPNSIKNAKETIIYAVVGLVITISGYGIVTFVVGRL